MKKYIIALTLLVCTFAFAKEKLGRLIYSFAFKEQLGRGYPSAVISNGQIKAKVATQTGIDNNYYRGSRFDWSGQIYDLTWNGHSYYGEFFPKFDPYNHDTVCGPAEEFAQIGYENANSGGEFVKIGVGVLQKPDNQPYNIRRLYKILDKGKWTCEVQKNAVVYTQTIKSNVVSYIYTKKIELVEGTSTMLVLHSLQNIGNNEISTNTYCHNFFMLDNTPSSKPITMKLSFTPTKGDFLPQIKGFAIVKDASILKDKKLTFTRTIVEPERVLYRDIPCENKVELNDFSIENSATGAAVRLRGDKPMYNLLLWANARTQCIEPWILINIKPNQTFSWTNRYDFYEVEKR